MNTTMASGRRGRSLPLAWFLTAHLALGSALGAIVVDPSLPGAFFYHPKMVAVVHLLTLGWITASILGALYIVGPFALRAPMPVRRADWIAWLVYWAGTSGMVAHFWMGRYAGMAWSAGLVVAAVAFVALRVLRALGPSQPRFVVWHLRLAFLNFGAASTIGILLGLDRTYGWSSISPIAVAYAHANLAAIGFAILLTMGVAYRLMPMMLPAAMPQGTRPWMSAVFLEAGLLVLVPALVFRPSLAPLGAMLIVGGFVAFFATMAQTARRRLPRPPALPARDWSLWQVHVAFAWLLAAGLLGLVLAFTPGPNLTALWLYGTAGLLGFLGQIIGGMQGRLVPFDAWLRAMATGVRPVRAAHSLISPRLAALTCLAWTIGVPLLAGGLALGTSWARRLGALVLVAGLTAGVSHLLVIARRAGPIDESTEDAVHTRPQETQCA